MEKGFQLPEAQLEIMNIIWANGGSIMFSQLASALQQKQKSWKTNTVLTFLSRLVDKKVLAVQKQGRLNEYVALISEEEYKKRETKNFIDKVYGGEAQKLVAALVHNGYLSDQQYEDLEQFWKKEKQKK